MKSNHGIIPALLLVVALCTAEGVLAQAWPAKPVRIISTIPLGGSGDVTATT
mgnify:FL=1